MANVSLLRRMFSLRPSPAWGWIATVFAAAASMPTGTAEAQSVGLPAPRLLTTMPMGGTAGSTFDVVIGGDFLDGASSLVFSDPRITAVAKSAADGKPEIDKFAVTIAADCPPGIYEARLMTRLGLSSSRAFSVGKLPEVVRDKPNTTPETAFPVAVNSVCNAAVTARAIDYYSFEAERDERILIDCATKGVDSKLAAVVIVADAAGNDLLVERRGAPLDFTAPSDGKYLVKVHELTYQGGPAFFYRLTLRRLGRDEAIVAHPSTGPVNSFSWPPTGSAAAAALNEREPNNSPKESQRISLPCDIAGSFFPAADADLFEFEAKKGESWWVEVASERLGLPTDPAITVQFVEGSGDAEKLTDVAEMSDIASPVKVSSNGYAYDGPPYNAGSSDILAKLDIARDGRYRLKITDLFGGTRTDARNRYRLVIRKAEPDFALVAWALHMELRNGDRNALSKPMALRSGATMALEVVAFRRDGFDGEIDLAMEGLPSGVRATGLKIPAGKSRGIMLITADAKAPTGFASVKFFGRAKVAGKDATRPCRLASMAWPVADAWSEIPYPRLLADVPVSVTSAETAPLTLVAATSGVIEAKAGSKLKIPLNQTRRGEFSGGTVSLNVFGNGFEQVRNLSVPLTSDKAEVEFDLAALKTPPGDYVVALYGGAVTKYRYLADAVPVAEAKQREVQKSVAELEAEFRKLTESAKAAPPAMKAEMEKRCKAAESKQKAAMAELNAATDRVKRIAAQAEPKGIVDIVVSEPITIRVLPAETK